MKKILAWFLMSWAVLQTSSDEIQAAEPSFPSVNASQRILSRKRRYLIFPEGSSLQLVYCLTLPIIGYSTMFTLGGTAALAWELPHEPYRFHKDRKKVLDFAHNKDGVDKASKRIDKIFYSSKRIDRPSGGGWRVEDPGVIIEQKQPVFQPFPQASPVYNTIRYNQEPAVHHKPSRRKYSGFRTGYKTLAADKLAKKPLVRKKPSKWTVSPTYSHYYNDYDERWTHHIHRRTKRDLYVKIVDFFAAQAKDGKACLLKALCEVSQAPNDHSGSFMQEIVKAIFRYRPHNDYQDEEHDEYDKAYNKEHNCTEQYPTCNSSVWNKF